VSRSVHVHVCWSEATIALHGMVYLEDIARFGMREQTDCGAWRHVGVKGFLYSRVETSLHHNFGCEEAG
jgi:hypothetical protein